MAIRVLLVVLYAALLVMAASPAAAGSNDLRVLVMEWITEKLEAEPFDAPTTQGVLVNFLLAAKHFNERRVDILPVLGTLGTCARNISIVAVCDEGGYHIKSAQALTDMKGTFDAVAGFASIAVQTGAVTANADYRAPVLSHWSSLISMTDPDNFPLFARTYWSDNIQVQVLRDLVVKQLKYSRVVTMYVDDDIVPGINAQLIKVFGADNVDVMSFPYDFEVPSTIESALARMKATDRTLIIFLGWESDIRDNVAKMACQAGLNSSEYLWIFTSVLDVAVDPEFTVSDPYVRDFLFGSLMLAFENPDPIHANSYLDLFSTEFADNEDALVSTFNDILPPHGFQNDSLGCKDSSVNISLPADFFSSFDPLSAQSVWFDAYDTIIAYGLAACQQTVKGGEGLMASLKLLKFDGMSGPIEFDSNGDRKRETTNIVLYNWIGQNGTSKLRTEQCAVWKSLPNGTWRFFNESTLQFRSGRGFKSLSGEFTLPVQTMNYLPDGLQKLGYAEVAFGIFASLCCLMWMLRHRHSPVIRAGQINFLAAVCVGCIFASFSILPLTADDSPSNPLRVYLDTSCMAAPFLFFLSFQLVLGVLLGKTIRAHYVFSRKSLYHGRVKIVHILFIIATMLSIALALLLAWYFVSPMVFKRIPTLFNNHAQVLDSRGECTFMTPEGPGFFAALAVFHVIALILLRIAASLSENFVEERNLSVALLQTFLLAVPGVIAVFSSPIGRFVLLSTLILFCVFVTLLFVFYPKYVIENDYRKRMLVLAQRGDNPNYNKEEGFVDILTGLRIPAVQAKFEKFAKENYVTESFLFIVDVHQFQEDFEKQNNVIRQDHFRSILSVYIEAGSLLQINISEKCRVSMEKKAKAIFAGREILLADFFEPALKEVADMLNPTSWSAFVQDGGMFNVRASLIPRKGGVLSWMMPSASVGTAAAYVTNSSNNSGGGGARNSTNLDQDKTSSLSFDSISNKKNAAAVVNASPIM